LRHVRLTGRPGRGDCLDRRGKAVPCPDYGLDPNLFAASFGQLVAEAANGGVDSVRRVDDVVVVPESRCDVVAGDQFARPRYKEEK
jgi:hypothetical protein